MSFRVELDTYRGPLDLLLYPRAQARSGPVRHSDRADCGAVPGSIFLLLEVLDVDEVGDFIELASMLLEIKSQMCSPQKRRDDELDDPRDELVERLLEYKKFKDAASILDERSRAGRQRCPRLADDLPPRRIEPTDQPIQEIGALGPGQRVWPDHA